MIQENEIRSALLGYLSGDQSLDELEDWLVQHSWNMHRDSDARSQRLASQIELVLAEFNSGHLPKASMHGQLRRLVSTYVASFDQVTRRSEISYTSNSTVQIPPVGMPTAEVSVS